MKNLVFTAAGVLITAMFLWVFYASNYHLFGWAFLGIISAFATLVGSYRSGSSPKKDS
jgi:hypothetical membrane protein